MKTCALLFALAAATVSASTTITNATLIRRPGRQQVVQKISTDLQSQLDFLFSNATLMRVGFAYALTSDKNGVTGAIEVGPLEQPNEAGGWTWLDLFPTMTGDPRLFRLHPADGKFPAPWSDWGQQPSRVALALPGRNPRALMVGRDVLYGNILPGVEMKAYVDPDGIDYQFVTTRGALPSLVLEFEANVEVRGDGSLRLFSGTHSMIVEPAELSVAGGKMVSRGPHRVGFELPQEQPQANLKPADRQFAEQRLAAERVIITLTLDRPLDVHFEGAARYLLRGGGDDVVTDAAGNVYVAGPANAHLNEAELTAETQATGDFFVARLNADGTTAWVTFGGGSGAEEGPFRVAALRDGHVYVAGTTSSADMPSSGAPHGGRDAFLAMFDGRDGAYLGATRIGGRGDERVSSLATDGVSRIVIGGTTTSDGSRGFVAEVAPAVWTSYTPDAVDAVAVDRDGAIYTATRTTARDLAGATDLTSSSAPKSLPRIVVTKLAPSRTVQWSAIVGASASPVHMAAGDFGDVFVAGSMGDGLPEMPEMLQVRCRGGSDVFVEHLAEDGASLLYSTYIGGTGNESLFRMAVDHDQNVYLAGSTSSADFPLTVPANFRLHDNPNLFLAKLDRFGHTLLRSTLLAACDSLSADEMAIGMSVDARRNTWLAVQTHLPVFTLAPPGTNGVAVAGAAVLKIAPCTGCREAPTIEAVKQEANGLRVRGTGFDPGARVFLDTKPPGRAAWINAQTIDVAVPADAPPRFLLQVINDDNQGASYEVALDLPAGAVAAAQTVAKHAAPPPDPTKKHDFGPLLRNLKFISVLALIAFVVVMAFRRLLH
jgi:hypothetical protein